MPNVPCSTYPYSGFPSAGGCQKCGTNGTKCRKRWNSNDFTCQKRGTGLAQRGTCATDLAHGKKSKESFLNALSKREDDSIRKKRERIRRENVRLSSCRQPSCCRLCRSSRRPSRCRRRRCRRRFGLGQLWSILVHANRRPSSPSNPSSPSVSTISSSSLAHGRSLIQKDPAGIIPRGLRAGRPAVSLPVGTHRPQVGGHVLQRASARLPQRRPRRPLPSGRTRGWLR